MNKQKKEREKVGKNEKEIKERGKKKNNKAEYSA